MSQGINDAKCESASDAAKLLTPGSGNAPYTAVKGAIYAQCKIGASICQNGYVHTCSAVTDPTDPMVGKLAYGTGRACLHQCDADGKDCSYWPVAISS